MKKLTFEPSIYRDWTAMYSWFAYEMFIKGFQTQFGWHYTDVMFVWDGEKVTIYRAIEEHIHEFFALVDGRLKDNPHFVAEVAEKVVHEVNALKPFLDSILEGKLGELSSDELLRKFETSRESVLTVTPWFLILMYFPQQLERLGLDQYKQDFDIAVEARGKVDKTLGPLSNKATNLLAAEALRRNELPAAGARYLAPHEFKKLVTERTSERYNKTLRQSLIEREPYWMIAGGDISTESVEEYIQRHGWKLNVPEVKDETTEIKGNSVHIAETLVGVVRIVPNQREIHKVQEGDVVVAPMTTPEYGPIFGKIKAIITDEGGITCHAAVISREMKIPAIVGTKIASRVLKDGDRIEVDTERGVIRVVG
jgi:phosphohistidine swiveling domain-containing protein